VFLHFGRARRGFAFYGCGRLSLKAMNATLISEECDCEQNEYDDEYDALFVLREFENHEKLFHLVA